MRFKVPCNDGTYSSVRQQTTLRPSYLRIAISYTYEMKALYWIRAQIHMNPTCMV